MLGLLGVERNNRSFDLQANCRKMELSIADLDGSLKIEVDGYPANFVEKLDIILWGPNASQLDTFIADVGVRMWRHVSTSEDRAMVGLKFWRSEEEKFSIYFRPSEVKELKRILKEYWTI